MTNTLAYFGFLQRSFQNIHRASKKIKIQWLSENEKSQNDKGDVYIKEFYDTIGKAFITRLSGAKLYSPPHPPCFFLKNTAD
jgi:hypothetical protein